MKTIKFLVLSMLLIIAFGCEEDKQGLEISNASISIQYGDSLQLNAKSDYPVVYSSENLFHAGVSEAGLVKGYHIGSTSITVSSNDQEVSIPIEVTSKYNFYAEPITEWGMSKTELISKVGAPDEYDSDGNLSYTNPTSDITLLRYFIDSNDELYGVGLGMNYEDYTEILGTVNERYMIYDVNSSTLTLSYSNAMDKYDATTLVELRLNVLENVIVVYVENTPTKSATISNIKRSFQLN